jgi:hypothetical protein
MKVPQILKVAVPKEQPQKDDRSIRFGKEIQGCVTMSNSIYLNTHTHTHTHHREGELKTVKRHVLTLYGACACANDGAGKCLKW